MVALWSTMTMWIVNGWCSIVVVVVSVGVGVEVCARVVIVVVFVIVSVIVYDLCAMVVLIVCAHRWPEQSKIPMMKPTNRLLPIAEGKMTISIWIWWNTRMQWKCLALHRRKALWLPFAFVPAAWHTSFLLCHSDIPFDVQYSILVEIVQKVFE